MSVNISGRNVNISDAFREIVGTGLSLLKEKHGVEPIDTQVLLTKEGHQFRTDLSIHLGKSVTLRSTGFGDDGYQGFNHAIDMMIRRLRRHKKRLSDHHRQHDHHGSPKVPYYVLDGHEEEEAEGSPAIIAESKKEIEHLSVADAVMRLDLGQEPAYVFKNKQTDRLNVLYRRSDGNIGWIDTEYKS
jgi:ribosomal subunit interface protein